MSTADFSPTIGLTQNATIEGSVVQLLGDDIATAAFDALRHELAWVHREDTPRHEYYVADSGLPYAYGSGGFMRHYDAMPTHPWIKFIRAAVEREVGAVLDVCFLNLYLTNRDHLGWHSDDSPEMDDARPIVSVSLGAERAIEVRPIGSTDRAEWVMVMLPHGSAFVMPPGMQDTHQHRIPKDSRNQIGERISLTFRGYKAPVKDVAP